MKKTFFFFVALLAVLSALPFSFRFRTDEFSAVPEDADVLVVITPHGKSIRDEYERAFRRYYFAKRGRDVRIDFRVPGGTSDAVRYVADRFEAEFRRYYTATGAVWSEEIARTFSDPASDRSNAPEAVRAARAAFLASDVGIGIDVMAGGGVFDHEKQARRGFAVPGDLEKRHPEYFRDIPADFGGSPVYDREGRYYSVVLSTFGIVCNLDRLKEKNIPVPETWADLARPEFFGMISVADPTKSGSVTKCFEIIIQQAMNEADSPAEGWARGINLVKRIFGNARSFSDSAATIVREVGEGNSAAAIAIDSYAISEREYRKELFDGDARLAYIMPKGGTAVSGDPVQVLRGAPHRRVADDFLDFLFSREGQTLHCYRVGTPGGPEIYPLNRPPVRRDIYDENYRRYAFDPDADPYRAGENFVYHAERTGRFYPLIRQTIKLLMLDCRDDLVAASRAIRLAGGPQKVPRAAAEFDALPFSYEDADAALAALTVRPGNDAAAVARTMRRWSDFAREHYRRAAELAKAGL
ncbi:MAG: ABC transporter substrate-binding protein [Victivallaceae bacterium]|nr:ABC transporter substrate-binding protein [Victivallaceae bacterium]